MSSIAGPVPLTAARPSVGARARDWLAQAWATLAIGNRPLDQWALALVLLLTAVDAIFFSTMATQRFLSHSAGAFDMGIEDQTMWSTLHGRLFGVTLERRLTTSYLGYHFEPISIVGPLLYLVYPSPISLVVFKNVALALGMIPAYWLARKHLGSATAGVSFAVVYALFPGLEAAGLYDFHAYTLTAPLLLAAFCFLEVRRYGWLLIFLALAAATKENSPLDALPLGLFLAVVHRRWRLGLGMAAVGVAWFAVATYVIIPHFNTQGQQWLWNRYGGMGGSPVGALLHFVDHPNLLLAPVPSDPNWAYLARLLAPVAWLTLLSPTALFLMGPALAVNLLTDYAPMHLIETYHYSAHLVPFVILGAVYGMGTLTVLARRVRLPSAPVTGALCALMLATTLVYHHYRGYTPLSGEFVGYRVTAHDQLGNQLADQLTRTLPPNVAVSAQDNQYAHLSHRLNIWEFPEISTADVVFLDVSTLPNTTGINEGIHQQVRGLLDHGAFGPVIADDGYLVLQRGAPRAPLPDAFYSFARATNPQITHPLNVAFTDGHGTILELLGYDLIPGRDGEMNLRAYWRAPQPVSRDLFLGFYITDGQGNLKGAALHRQPANFWYPTSRWRPGEIVQVTSLNLPVGRRGKDFGIALGAQPNDDPWNTAGRLYPVVRGAPAPLRTPGQGTLLEVATFHNDHDLLTPVTAPLQPMTHPAQPLNVAFGDGIRLQGYTLTHGSGALLHLVLYWHASGPTPVPLTVFTHLLNQQGQLVAQHDAPPQGGMRATTAWLNGEVVADPLDLTPPADLTPAGVQLELGMYDPVTGRRLPATVDGRVVDHLDLPVPAALLGQQPQ